MTSRLPLAFFLLWCGLTAICVATLNNGHITYALDDAYIHLALAERIAAGHYGINANEFSAPASSVIWPFLLVPFSPFRVAEYVPLALNVLFSCALILVLSTF